MGLVFVSVQVFLDFDQLLGESVGFWKLYDIICCYTDGFFLVIIGHFFSSFVDLYGSQNRTRVGTSRRYRSVVEVGIRFRSLQQLLKCLLCIFSPFLESQWIMICDAKVDENV